MRGPDLVIGGTAKGGTTSLSAALSNQVGLHMCPRKEAHHYLFQGSRPHFSGPGDERFMEMVVSDASEWSGLLGRASPGELFGEASVYYLFRPMVWKALQDASDGRLSVVLVLRNPLDRIASAWGHLVRDGRETLPLEDALEAEPERRAAGWEWCWEYEAVSRYGEQLEALFTVVDRARVLVLDHSQLSSGEVVPRVLAHLGLQAAGLQPLQKLNTSGAVRSRRLHGFLNDSSRLKDVLRPLVPDRLIQSTYRMLHDRNLSALEPMSTSLRLHLSERFASEARAVSALTGLDTSHWR